MPLFCPFPYIISRKDIFAHSVFFLFAHLFTSFLEDKGSVISDTFHSLTSFTIRFLHILLKSFLSKTKSIISYTFPFDIQHLPTFLPKAFAC